MVKKLYTESYIQNIADAIRTVNGKTTKYYVRQMAEAILDLGSAGDSILDNSASDAVVDLETNITSLSDYKMYQANKLETVKAPNLTNIGRYSFASDSNLYSIELPNASLNLQERSLASDSKLYKVVCGTLNYVGIVSSIPPVAVRTAENPHGGNLVFEEVSNYDFKEGDLVFNSSDSKVYEYNGSGWINFLPAKASRVGPYVFAGASNFEFYPYRIIGCNPPTIALADYNNMFRDCRLKTIYLDADNFDANERGSMGKNLFYHAINLEKVWLLSNGQLSDDISLIFDSLSDYFFYQCTQLKSATFTNITSIGSYAVAECGIDKIIAPNVTSVGTGGIRQNPNMTEVVLGALTSFPTYLANDNPKLEKFTFGNGTNTPSSTNSQNLFKNCPMMWYMEMNTTAIFAITGTITNTFQNTPLINFMGTTTTEITEGSTVTSVVIDGATKTAANNNIVSYGGKDWILTSGAWTEWGTNGDKHPIIKVPSSLISEYQSHAQWSKFSPEIWQAI